MKFSHARRFKIFLAVVGILILERFLWNHAMRLYDCDYAYTDPQGDVVLDGYCFAQPFHEGPAAVSLDNEYHGGRTFIDSQGESLFETDTDVVSSFSEGLLAVKERKADESIGLGGYLNALGETAIDFQFGDESHYGMTDFSEGLAAVYDPSAKAWGYIDATGVFIIAPQFSEAEPFHEGRAAVTTWSKETWYMRGYIDTKGEWIIGPASEYFALDDFSDGLALVHGEGSSSYFIDDEGAIIVSNSILEPYWSVESFHEGRALVGLQADPEAPILFGYLDTSGELVIDAQWYNAENFSDGLALVEKGDQKAFINEQGEVVMDVSMYDMVFPFSEGFAGVCQFLGHYSWENRCGFVDRTGALAIPLRFENISTDYTKETRPSGFSEGLAVVETVKPLWARILYRVHAAFTSPDFN